MDLDPMEIKRMMEQRQRELRGKHSAAESANSSPTKRLRQEKENAFEPSSPPKQGFMAKFAVSPKNPRKEANTLSQASPSTKTRLNELSKRYAEMEDDIMLQNTASPSKSQSRKKLAPHPPASSPSASKMLKKKAPSPPRSKPNVSPQKTKKWEIHERTASVPTKLASVQPDKNDPSLKKVCEKAAQFNKPDEHDPKPTIPKTKIVPRGKIAEKVSRFDVGTSAGPRCVIETKPLGSVSSRAKFFEKAMEADRKAANAVYVPVSQRTAKMIEREEQALAARATRPVVCSTAVSPSKKLKKSIEEEIIEEDDHQDEYEEEEGDDMEQQETEQCQNHEESVHEPEQEPEEITETPEQEPEEITETPEQIEVKKPETPKKVGQVSSKLKNRLEDLIVHGHQTPDDTLMSISEKTTIQHQQGQVPALDEVAEEDDDDMLLSPQIPRQTKKFMDDDTISRITGLPEDGHSTPKPCSSSQESLATPLRKTMSQYRRDEKEAQEREPNVKRIVYEIPSNMMQEIRKNKDSQAKEEENTEGIDAYKRQIEEEIIKQESIIKQTSHALFVCQENGDRGSEQQIEAERLLLIATQRHHVAQSELQRINHQRSIPQSGGTLTICDIKLPYKNDFLKLMRQCNDVLENTHYFIVLVRSGASLLHTELVSTEEKISGGSVNLNHHMVLKNLQEGFRVFVEVHAVQALNRHHPEYEGVLKKIRREKEKESHKGGILSAFTPSKKKNTGTPSNQEEQFKIRKPSFGLIGRVTLDETLIAMDKQVHYMDCYFNESPLDGRILMKIQLNMPPKVTHCGMLRLKDEKGYISSYFGAIEGSHLNLWNDMRAAEDEQEPIRSFDLSEATNTVQVQQSFSFYYFPLKLSNGLELQFLTYGDDESNLWADKLNACITRLKKKH